MPMFTLLLALTYICFISLGLPDSLLGAAWPVMQQQMEVPLSFAGIVSLVICLNTIISSLFSDFFIRKLGIGRIIAISVATTAIALFGFSVSDRYWMLLLWAIPYGLGAGCVDSVLNNYAALHFKSQHMSWLHCMWGVGASISPYIMSFALVRLDDWHNGYLIVAGIQIVLSLFIFMTVPLWKGAPSAEGVEETAQSQPMSVRQILAIPGAVVCFITFFGYCALELTSSLWASSYLVQARGVSPEVASGCASLFYIGLTAGRAINGFLAMKFSDRFLIRLGLGIIFAGILLVFIPFDAAFACVGFVIVGLGCAPVYPCIIHMTPDHFGKDKSQAIIGIQIAFAYTGFCIMPPLFGLIANHISIGLLPAYLLALLVLIVVMHEKLVNTKTKQ